MVLPHESMDDEPSESVMEEGQLPPPEAALSRVAQIKSFVDKMSRSMVDLRSAQASQARAVGTVGSLISGSALHAAAKNWPDRVGPMFQSEWASTSDDAAAPIQKVDAALKVLSESILVATKATVSAYEAAYRVHELAKTRLTKGEKKRAAVLQQEERDTRSKALAAAKLARAKLELLEQDWAMTVLNVAREVAHAQLVLHANGVEHFSGILSRLHELDAA